VKTVRSWLIVLGATVAVAIVLLAVALVPAVQRRALLWFASGRPGLAIEVDHLAIRPGVVEVRGLRVQQSGAQVVVGEASFQLSLWQAIVHRRLILHNARVTGMKVDLTHYAGQAATGGAATLPNQPGAVAVASPEDAKPGAVAPDPPLTRTFSGVFKHLTLPCEVVLDACDVEVDVVFPRTAGRLPGGARVKLTGGHFGPRRNAEFDFDATIRNPDPGAPVAEVAAQGALTATLNSQSAVERVGIHMDAVARGPLVPATALLQADMVLARTPVGESYSLAVNSIEAGVVSRLLNLDSDYVAGSSTLTGSWQVLANHRQVAPFAFDFAVPEFSVSGDGRFEVSFAARNLQLAGRLTGNASRLDTIDPRFREIDGLGATATFDLRYDRGQLRVADLTARISAGKPVLSVQTLQAFTVTLATGDIAPSGAQRELVRINLDGVPMSWIRSFFPGYAISGDAIEGELVAALHGADRVWLRTTSPLSVRGLAVSQGARVLLPASDLSLDAEVEHARDGTRIRMTNLNIVTATGDQLDGHGELAVAPDLAMVLQASFNANLPTLMQDCVPAGPMIAHGSIALSQSGDILQVDRMEAHLATAAGRPLVDMTSPEAFRVDPGRRQIALVAGTSGEVLRVKYGRLPLNVSTRWSAGFAFKGELTGGEFALRAEADGLRFAGLAPFRMQNVVVTNGEATWFKDLSVEAAPSFTYTPKGMTARLAGIGVKNLNGDLLLSSEIGGTGESDFASLKFQGTTSFDLSVGAMAGQPLLAGLEPPRQGKLTGNAKFSFDRDLLGEGRLTLNGLVSPGTGEALPVANLSFRVGLNGAGDIAVQAPILVDRAGGRSDLTLAATLHPAADGRTIDAKITGEHLAVDDVLQLFAAFSPAVRTPPSVPEGAPPADPAPKPPAGPAWKGLTGQLRFEVKSVDYGRFPGIFNLKGRAVIEPLRVSLENMTARFGAENARLQLDGEIRCSEGDPQPYKSSVVFEVKAFDLGPVFKTMDPGKAPTLEGRFDIHGRAEGAGRTLDELIRPTKGDLVLQSRKGISRLLDRPPPAPPKSTGIVSGVANTAARLIDDLGEKVGKMVSYTDPTDEIAGMLAEVPFDQLSLRVSRDPAANLRLSEFSLVSPVLRLQGEGVITHEAAKALFDRPLKLTLSLGVMGTVEKAMTQAKAPMLSSSRDELGYLKSSDTFEITGTPARPDPSQLYTMVARSMIGKLLH
jgi:hypothetical protein